MQNPPVPGQSLFELQLFPEFSPPWQTCGQSALFEQPSPALSPPAHAVGQSEFESHEFPWFTPPLQVACAPRQEPVEQQLKVGLQKALPQ
jgi:hypothetical protein